MSLVTAALLLLAVVHAGKAMYLGEGKSIYNRGIMEQLVAGVNDVKYQLEEHRQNQLTGQVMLPGQCTGLRDNEILVQQHFGGSTFFTRTWNEFRVSFGDVDGNYWIGNDRLSELTHDGRYGLRIELLSKANNRWYWAEYRSIRVMDEQTGYVLNIGGYSGTAGDSLADVNRMKFSSKDRDNDADGGSCTVSASHGNSGGFWYKSCGFAYINSPAGNFQWRTLPVDSDKTLVFSRMKLFLM